MLDRQGSKAARRRVEEDAAAAARQTALSAVEHKLIKRKVVALNAGQLTKQQERVAAVTTNKAVKTVVNDPWGDDIYSPIERPAPKDFAEEVSNRKSQIRAGQGLKAEAERKKVIKVAHTGMSYNPAEELHQDLLAEALALEIKKKEKLAKEEGSFYGVDLRNNENMNLGTAGGRRIANTSIAAGAGAGLDSEEDDDSSEDESVSADGSPRTLSRKQKLALNHKKTRAERNKEKEKKAAARVRMQEAEVRALNKGLANVPQLLEAMQKKHALQAAAKQLKASQKTAQELEDAKALTYDEAGLVPLSDELGGSLRTLIPKGNNASVFQKGLIAAGEATSKDHRRRKVGEHPHKPKNIKWVAKYKYN